MRNNLERRFVNSITQLLGYVRDGEEEDYTLYLRRDHPSQTHGFASLTFLLIPNDAKMYVARHLVGGIMQTLAEHLIRWKGIHGNCIKI